MENYLNDAFKRLSLVEEEVKASDVDWEQKVKDYLNNDIEMPKDEEIIDPQAEVEDDLQDTYAGKIVVECSCCHTRLYKEQEEIEIDPETGLANIQDICPVCDNACGYNVIGKIEPFDAERDIEKEAEEIEAAEENEDDAADIDFEYTEPNEEADDDVEADLEDDDDDYTEAFKNVFESLKNVKGASEDSKRLDEGEGEDFGEDDICPECGEDHAHCHCHGHHEHHHHDDHEPVEEGCMKEAKGGNALQKLQALMKNEALTEADEQYYRVEEGPKDLVDNFLKGSGFGESLKNSKLASEDDKRLDEEVHVEATGEDKVDIKKNDDGSMTLNVGDGFGEDDIDVEGGEEMIAPLDQEESNEIESQVAPEEDEFGDDEFTDEASSEEEMPVEDELGTEEEMPEEEGEEDMEFDEFENESFNYLGNSYLRKIYENVNEFTTTGIKDFNDKVVVEGLITFNSGKQKSTKFVFEDCVKTKRGKLVLEGYNPTFSNSKKSFILKGNLQDKKFVCESLTYNYKTKSLNEAEGSDVRVSGRAEVR